MNFSRPEWETMAVAVDVTEDAVPAELLGIPSNETGPANFYNSPGRFMIPASQNVSRRNADGV